MSSIQLIAKKTPQLNYDHTADSLTYAQYLASDWEALLLTAQAARKDNVSFYYLTLRTAYASFYTQRYNDALSYFEKAEALQMGNDITKELYYLSALYTGRVKETERLYKLLPEEQKNSYDAPSYKWISSLSLNAGRSVNTDFDELLSQEIHGGYAILGERILLKNTHFQNAALQHKVNSSFTIEQSLGHVHLNKEQSFYYQDNTNNILQIDDYSISTTQWQYHVKASYNVDDNLSIMPAFTLIHFDAENVFGFYDEQTTLYSFTKGNIEDYQYLFSLRANYRLGRNLLSISSNQMRSGKNTRWQYGGGLTLHPFKGKAHYISGNVYTYDNYFYSNSNNWKTIWQIKAGWNIDKVWMAVIHSHGNHQFFADNDGLLVYNTYERIRSQTGANVHIPVLENQLWINIYYRYVNYETSFFYLDDAIELQKGTLAHNNHSITGGLSWKF